MTTIDTSGEDILDEIRAAWTHGASDYDLDRGHGYLTPVVEDAWLSVLRGVLGETPRDVVDVGCGTGFLTVLLAKLGHRVTGVDLTPAMLERAAERMKLAGVNATLIEGNALALPLESDSFDAVVSRHVLWTMPEPDAAFREWIRVTRPGGEVLWFDGLQRPPSPKTKARGLAARVAKKASRTPDHAHGHHYDQETAAHLPFRGLQSTQPIRELLSVMGVEGVSCRALPALTRVERSAMELHKRLAPGSTRYVGRFPVTIALKERQSGNGEAVPETP